MIDDDLSHIELIRDLNSATMEMSAALITMLDRIDTLEKQVGTLTKDLAKVALSKRKYVSDVNLNKE